MDKIRALTTKALDDFEGKLPRGAVSTEDWQPNGDGQLSGCLTVTCRGEDYAAGSM
jgi:hypothetical protein